MKRDIGGIEGFGDTSGFPGVSGGEKIRRPKEPIVGTDGAFLLDNGSFVTEGEKEKIPKKLTDIAKEGTETFNESLGDETLDLLKSEPNEKEEERLTSIEDIANALGQETKEVLQSQDENGSGDGLEEIENELITLKKQADNFGKKREDTQEKFEKLEQRIYELEREKVEIKNKKEKVASAPADSDNEKLKKVREGLGIQPKTEKPERKIEDVKKEVVSSVKKEYEGILGSYGVILSPQESAELERTIDSNYSNGEKVREEQVKMDAKLLTNLEILKRKIANDKNIHILDEASANKEFVEAKEEMRELKSRPKNQYAPVYFLSKIFNWLGKNKLGKLFGFKKLGERLDKGNAEIERKKKEYVNQYRNTSRKVRRIGSNLTVKERLAKEEKELDAMYDKLVKFVPAGFVEKVFERAIIGKINEKGKRKDPEVLELTKKEEEFMMRANNKN
jgi:hypothetical protein